MGFDSLFRNGVATIDKITASLQGTVQRWAWQSEDGRGRITYTPARTAPGSPLQCVVDYTTKQHARADGKIINVIATLTFPRPTLLDSRDIIVLPNGQTAPIQSSPDSVADPTTGLGYFTKAMLGSLG